MRYEVNAKAYRSAYPLGQALTELPLIPCNKFSNGDLHVISDRRKIVFFEDSDAIIGLDSRSRNQYRELESTTDLKSC